MLLQGFIYCVFAAAFWPSLTMSVEPSYNGLCFGVASSLQNISLAVVHIAMAYTYTSSNSRYIPNVEYMFAILSVLSFLFCLGLYFLDYKLFVALNSPNVLS